MVLFVEGQDCTGKSTLIKNLSENLSFSTHHFDKPFGDNDDGKYHYQMGQFQLMFDMVKSSNINWLFDRSHIGEMVYGPMWRNRFPTYIEELESQFIKDYNSKSFVIYLSCDADEIKNRFKSRPDEHCPSETQITNDNKMFLNALDHTLFEVIYIDTTNTSADEVFEIVNNKINTQEEK